MHGEIILAPPLNPEDEPEGEPGSDKSSSASGSGDSADLDGLLHSDGLTSEEEGSHEDSSSSSDEPGASAPSASAAAPPPPPPPPGGAGGVGMPAWAVLDFEGGRISYNLTKDEMIATCSDPRHNNCRKWRSCRAGARPQQGRPVGFLAAWLYHHGRYPNAVDHKKVNSYSRDERRAARTRVEALGAPAAALLNCERRQRVDELHPEPNNCP